MRKILFLLVTVVTFFTNYSFSQTLAINEVSQGMNGQEYVEFVVLGDTICDLSAIQCIDLRKVIFDDNNGWAGTEEISSGAMRFADSTFWSCIPQGTIIVIYNDLDMNPLIPPIDTDIFDGNFRLIIPGSSMLFESTTASPTGSPLANPTYPVDQLWEPGGNWATLDMSDNADAIQLPQTTGVTPNFMVSWGANSLNPEVYFASNAIGTVFSMMNQISSDYSDRINWTAGLVGFDETPGFPNSLENESYLHSMSRGFGTMSPLDNTFSSINESCVGFCDASATSIPVDGAGDYKYAWSTTDSTQTISGLCPGKYYVEVTDKYGCITYDSVTVFPGTTPGASTFSDPFVLKTFDSPVTYDYTDSTGYWTASCGPCIDSLTGVFDPSISGEGEFTVCHYIGTGDCADTTCKVQEVRNCDPESTYELRYLCEGFSDKIFDEDIYNTGTYTKVYTNGEGCDSTSIIEVVVISECGDETTKDFGYPLPNVFSPNGDGINDDFVIDPKYATISEAYIVSRWGDKVYTYNKSNIGWDGHDEKSGEILMEGTYFYTISYKDIKGKEKITKGFLTLAD